MACATQRRMKKTPFMTMAEIKRQLKGGADPDLMWEALYLQASELTELLAPRQGEGPSPVDLSVVLLCRTHRSQAVGDSPVARG